jgi:membrane-associated phospholipid phosphatase
MKNLICFLFIITFLATNSVYAQKSNNSPYKTTLAGDGTWVATSIGLNVLGVKFIQDKDPLTIEELNNLSKEDIWGIDRWAAGYHSEQANKDSYIPFYGSFVLPFALLLNEKERENAGQISVIFVETMATTGALFSITAGLVDKSRPLVYNSSLPEVDRIDNDEQRSFFAGHTAATAAASFFAAKVFNDFNPDSPLKPYVWGISAAIPAVVGYQRTIAGKHFLTDNLVGYAVGATCGILIPELHKKTDSNLQVYPAVGINYGYLNTNAQGLGMTYQF